MFNKRGRFNNPSVTLRCHLPLHKGGIVTPSSTAKISLFSWCFFVIAMYLSLPCAKGGGLRMQDGGIVKVRIMQDIKQPDKRPFNDVN